MLYNHHLDTTEMRETKRPTNNQKDILKTSINKLKAILEVEDEEERQEKLKCHSRINEQLQNLNDEIINEEFNYKDTKQLRILLNMARIELF